MTQLDSLICTASERAVLLPESCFPTIPPSVAYLVLHQAEYQHQSHTLSVYSLTNLLSTSWHKYKPFITENSKNKQLQVKCNDL